jgi:hypothetical protein
MEAGVFGGFCVVLEAPGYADDQSTDIKRISLAVIL